MMIDNQMIDDQMIDDQMIDFGDSQQQLAREKVLYEIWGCLVGELIIQYDRHHRMISKQTKFWSIHYELIFELRWLNSVRHPGYIIFFLGKNRHRDDDEVNELCNKWGEYDSSS